MSLRLSSVAEYETLLDEYDTWLFDCDGVLWRGDQVIDGVVQVFDLLRKRGEILPPSPPRHNLWHDFLDPYHGQGKKLVFVTNNATKSRKSYKKKFDQLGLNVHVVRIRSILCVSWNISSFFSGWNLWICICSCGVHLLCCQVAETQESLCYWSSGPRGRITRWGNCMYRRHGGPWIVLSVREAHIRFLLRIRLTIHWLPSIWPISLWIPT